LPTGQTERGFWAAASGEVPEVFPSLVASKISFPIPLAAALSSENVVFISQAETVLAGTARAGKVKTACGTTGTLANPTAEPGYLCVYTGVESLLDESEPSAQIHEEEDAHLEEEGEEPTVPRYPLKEHGVPVHATVGTASNAKFLSILNAFGSPGAATTGASVAFAVKEVRSEAEEEKEHEQFPNIVVSGSWAVTGH
jgi:hypothetical protein